MRMHERRLEWYRTCNLRWSDCLYCGQSVTRDLNRGSQALPGHLRQRLLQFVALAVLCMLSLSVVVEYITLFKFRKAFAYDTGLTSARKP